MSKYDKHVDAVLDYKFDWNNWLAGDVISEVTITVIGVSLELESNDDSSVTVWISGGEDNALAIVDCKIQTVGGRTDTRSMLFSVKKRITT